ncbi:aspartyl-phosphate phosphatase Spo0E family protein [Halalkalibacterium ligniniphilum]|uniref:aspartyl-phosphate phosphatase Spo0E family protein n=1 Tax=Halalkalibacterium ligniniphilum TaxID=1134413 RepID=UPI000379F1B2|nr:aspartyl-phosphate phosphatase Spo0E family protein [Halalkalibacterium ligniniphilum]
MEEQSNKQRLLFEIENFRQSLNDLGRSQPLDSNDIIVYSQKLDSLLNQYTSLSVQNNPATHSKYSQI